MRILVTGAAGFVGFHVARLLLARGDSVVGFDNVNDYYDPALKEARLAELDRHWAATGASCAPTSPTAPRWRPPSRAAATTG